jgi:hypothetical protein
MMIHDLRQMRMHTQRLAGAPFDAPEAMVRWHLAVQAQDYPGAKWAIGQRTDGVTDADLDRAFNDGAILRTHVMRPTWHFVLPEDLRWLLALTAPRVHAGNAGRYRQLGLDDATLARSDAALARSLEGGRHLTRAELADALADAGIATEGQRLAHMLMHAELEALICSGPRKGKQFTYALLDERVPATPPRDRDDALAEITRRYFESHGPATPHDMAWWSGLTVTDCRRGIAALGDQMSSATVDDTTWWFFPPAGALSASQPSAHLLPAYDEYYIGFRQHQVAWHPDLRQRYDTTRELWAANLVAVDGQIVGGWRRKLAAKEVRIATTAPLDLDTGEQAALVAATEDYGRFIGLPVVIDDDAQ